MISPLQVDFYHFNNIAIKARKNIPEEVDPEKSSIRIDFSLKVRDNGDNKFAILLELAISPDEISGFPYEVKVELEGQFLVSESVPEKEREKAARLLGGSILVGAAREQVATITSRGPHSSFLIPPINLTGLKPDDTQQEAAAEETPTKRLPNS